MVLRKLTPSIYPREIRRQYKPVSALFLCGCVDLICICSSNLRSLLATLGLRAYKVLSNLCLLTLCLLPSNHIDVLAVLNKSVTFLPQEPLHGLFSLPRILFLQITARLTSSLFQVSLKCSFSMKTPKTPFNESAYPKLPNIVLC